jgi:predicted hotdog family 3-hydroxylacyl-ACP dehydratase
MPAAEFVMHRDSMLLLDTLVDCSGDTTLCEWTVGDDHAFIEGERGVPAYVGIEFMAQCVAVHGGVRARVDGKGPPLGYLLGTRHFKASLSHFAIGETYRASCEELILDGNGLGSYDCKIMHGDKCVANARLAVVEKKQGPDLK